MRADNKKGGSGEETPFPLYIIMIQEIGHYLKFKVKDLYKRQLLQQEAAQKNAVLQQANYLKAALKPHLRNILRENITFSKIEQIHMADAMWDSQNRRWSFSLELIYNVSNAEFDLSRPRVILSLNESKDLYFHDLALKQQDDFNELSLMAEAPNANSVNLELTRMQIAKKYWLLNNNLQFSFIEPIESSTSRIFKVWFYFY